MTKKKTPSPVKSNEIERDVDFTGSIVVSYSQFKALEAENESLKTLLSKHQSEPMPQGKPIQEQRITMLSQFAEVMEVQLSRLDNSLTTMDKISNRLVIQKEESGKPCAPEGHDLSSRLGNLLGYFSQQNDRLDMLNAKLSDLI